MAPQAGEATSVSSLLRISSSGPTFYSSEPVVANDTLHVTSTYASQTLHTTSSAWTTGVSPTAPSSSEQVPNITTTIVYGPSATSILVEIPSGSIFTSLPSATPEAATQTPNNAHLSSWRAFLVAFFVIVFFFLSIRLGVYFLFRNTGRPSMVARWPRWLQVLCCYRPSDDEEELDSSIDSPTFMRQSYLEGGANYSEASRAQALALVREASLGSWRNRVRERALSPSDEDPVPPYPGPPLTPLDNPFADSAAAAESVHSSEHSEDSKEVDKESSEGERAAPSGSRRSP